MIICLYQITVLSNDVESCYSKSLCAFPMSVGEIAVISWSSRSAHHARFPRCVGGVSLGWVVPSKASDTGSQNQSHRF